MATYLLLSIAKGMPETEEAPTEQPLIGQTKAYEDSRHDMAGTYPYLEGISNRVTMAEVETEFC